MPIAQPAYPIPFVAEGVADAFDSTRVFDGACRKLGNLIFDRQNPEYIVARPGVVELTDFTGFTTPLAVTVHAVVAGVVYGMVQTSRNVGFEEPFAFDLTAGTFIAISGVTAANVPASAALTGAWTPPTMAAIGTSIIVTHPGFSGVGANFFGVINIANPAAPAWSSANLSTNALSTVPTAVANFNNRAWFATGNVAAYSDVLAPTARASGGQALTIGDSTAITGFAGLPITTTSSGIVQALLVFKAGQVWQVTGDASASPASTLALNYLSLTVGTASPRTIASTPDGVKFAGIDAPYVVDQLGVVKYVTKTSAQNAIPDIQQPFLNSTTPSRACGAYNAGIYRVCLDTIVDGTAVAGADYWFNETKRRWTGPHSFAYDCASWFGNYFVVSSIAQGAKLYRAQAFPTNATVYTDDGVAIMCDAVTATLPKLNRMTEKQVVESTAELSSGGVPTQITVTAYDENGNTLSTASFSTIASLFLWLGGVWGGGTWNAGNILTLVYNIPWTQPLVFKKVSLQFLATAVAGIVIGALYMRFQDAGYTNRGQQ